MPRVKISEFKAKSIVYPHSGLRYQGEQISKHNYKIKIDRLLSNKKYVIKVDQGVKKRNKLGLIGIGLPKDDLISKIEEFIEKGYSNFLIEEYMHHTKDQEKFLALERTRDGILVFYSTSGGVNIEENKDKVKSTLVTPESINEISNNLDIEKSYIEKIVDTFDNLYFSFLEINPLITINKKPIFLDMAVEVDSVADFFVNHVWTRDDFVETQKISEPEEIAIKKLADGSSASFKLVVLNPKGSIFTILSGGGASIVLADEVGNIGRGKELANYAEYSGGPTEEETYIFAKNILSLALKSPAKNKKIYIAGGVANFTDIRATFKGVIRALDEMKTELKKQNIKIYVRRGGPYQEEGLSIMHNFLDKSGLLGEVMGPDRILTEVITTN